MLDPAAVLSRREATLRSVATACLAGIALVQAIGLPSLLRAGKAARRPVDGGDGGVRRARPDARRRARRRRAPALARGRRRRPCWCSPAGRLPRAVRRPRASTGDPAASGRRCPARVCAALAVACLVRRGRRRAAHAGRRCAALADRGWPCWSPLAPGAGVLLVALGPGTLGGETVARGRRAHIHSHGSFENAIVFQAGSPAARAATTSYAVSRAAPDGRSSVALMIAAGLHLRLRRGRVPAPARRGRRPRSVRRDLAGARRAAGMSRAPSCARLRARRARHARRERRARRSAHATLLGSTPRRQRPRVAEGQQSVVLRFSEPVQILNRSDVSVVEPARPPGRHGRRAHASGDRAQSSSSRCAAPLAARQLHGALPRRLGRLALGRRRRSCSRVGGATLRRRRSSPAPAACRTPARPRSPRASSSSPRSGCWSACSPSAPLVWGPAVARRPAACGLAEPTRARCADGQQLFWRAFWALAVLAGARRDRRPGGQERRRLPHRASSARWLHPADAYRLVAASRFGDLLGLALRRAARARRRRVRRPGTPRAAERAVGRAPLARSR